MKATTRGKASHRARVQVDYTQITVSVCDGAPILQFDDGGGYFRPFRLKADQAAKLGKALLAAADRTR